MTRIILSSSNLMGAGSSVIRRPTTEKSNAELVSSLRSNFLHAQHAAHNHQVHQNRSGTGTNGHTEHTPANRIPASLWTSREGDDLYVPAVNFSASGLAEERSQYEITAKLFFLPHVPASCRCAQTKVAIQLVLDELHMPSIDLLIVSYPDIIFDAEDEDDELDGDDTKIAADLNTMISTWNCLEDLHDEGVIDKLGVSEFGSQRLGKFLERTRVRPSVDQINVRDCCVVPKPLVLYAKQENVELLTHNDCMDILPRGTLRELLGSGEKGAGVLADLDGTGDGLRGEVQPQWVIKYTAIVKDRGVIENKGYFALAELQER